MLADAADALAVLVVGRCLTGSAAACVWGELALDLVDHLLVELE